MSIKFILFNILVITILFSLINLLEISRLIAHHDSNLTTFLLLSLLVYMVMWIVNRLDVDKVWVYLLLGAVLWVCVFQSGIHPTLAGIATAFVVPLKSNKKFF